VPQAAGPIAEPRVAVGLVVFAAYLLLTCVFWGAYVTERGLPGETGFVELSMLRPGIEGFSYPYSPSRRYMSLSFHAAYLLSNGSYLSLHLILGGWILLTGWLTYIVVRIVAPQPAILAFLAGAIGITFGADWGLNWAGYVVQRQAIVFSLLAVWLLLVSWKRKRPWLLLLPACFQYFSLWTYEGCLPALLAVPLLLYRSGAGWRRPAAYCAAWFAMPAIKLASLLYANWILQTASYEASVLSRATTAASLGKAFAYFVSTGMAFWTWPMRAFEQAAGCEQASVARIAWPLLAGAVALVACSLWIRRFAAASRLPQEPGYGRLVSFGLLFLVLAYVPFCALEVVDLRRTQLIAAVPGAFVFATLAVWLDARLRGRGFVCIGVAAIVVGCGLSAGLLQQLGLARHWAVYRKVLSSIVATLPCVRENTLIVMVDLPARISHSVCANDPPSDPFRDVMWFNSGLQVLYPDTKLAGLYYRADGSGSDSIQFKFGTDGATLVKAGIGMEGERFGYDRMAAFRFDPALGAVLLDEFPWRSIPGAVKPGDYKPRMRIACATPPAEVRNRLAMPGSSR